MTTRPTARRGTGTVSASPFVARVEGVVFAAMVLHVPVDVGRSNAASMRSRTDRSRVVRTWGISSTRGGARWTELAPSGRGTRFAQVADVVCADDCRSGRDIATFAASG